MEQTQTAGAVQAQVPYYVVTMVCPLCHQPINFKEYGVTVCSHCGKSFVVKPVRNEGGGGQYGNEGV